MRHLFASRSTAALVGMLALVAAGGGYALASGGSNTINACIHRHGGDVYIAKSCANGDTAISWNKVGPQGPRGMRGPIGPRGPGATSINFTTAASASPTQ